MAKVVAVVGARLNSSRLPGKQLLELAGRPLIAHVFARLAAVPEIDKVVLATTADDYNRPLVDWAKANGQAVLAYAGDVNDLVGRVDAAVAAEDPDFVVYVCGDSPLIEPTTLRSLLRANLDDATADWVELAPPPVGKYIHEGFTVYRRALWQHIVAESCSADDREHVGSVMKRLRPRLAIKQIDDDPVFTTVDHRISVDTPSDYRFMSEAYRRWYTQNPPESIVSLRWLIGELQRDPAFAATNAAVRQKAVGEQSAPLLIVCQAGPGIGLGHLARCMALAAALQDRHFAGVRLLIQAPPVDKTGLALLPHRFIAADTDLVATVREELAGRPCRAVIFDLHPQHLPDDLPSLLTELGNCGVRRIGIDALARFAGPTGLLDLLCLPGFHVPAALLAACVPTPLRYGWPYYLIEPCRSAAPGKHAAEPLLVLTGGSDATGLGATLPGKLDAALPAGTAIVWVQGPYAATPLLPASSRLAWHVEHAPASLQDLMAQSRLALTIYGVSLFELLAHDVPSVVFSPYGARDDEELPALAAADVAHVADDEDAAVAALTCLLADPAEEARLARRGSEHVDGGGPARLAADIFALLS